MKLKFYQIDAFTDNVFKGNYAGVIILEKFLNIDIMQNIAAENNLSETAFIVKNEDESFSIRWFSPLNEIDFCGHATLASAFVLFENNEGLEKIKFTADAVGELFVSKEDKYIKMQFPNQKPEVCETPKELKSSLSIKPKEILKNRQAYFAVYENEEDVLNIKIDLEEIKKLYPLDVVITSSSKKYDFVSRYFWPANGGDEDPVTGSIHTGLAPYWAQKLNKNELVAKQVSKRGGDLICKVDDNSVTLLGKAVKYLEGEIYI